MTNEELVTLLEENDVPAADIEKINGNVDMAKIESIINASNNPREAAEKLKEAYPEIEVDDFLKQMDFVQQQIELAAKGENDKIPVQLTAEELDMVVGGGWWGNNWRKVAVAAGVGLLAGLFVGGMTAAMGGPWAGLAVGIVVAGGVEYSYYGSLCKAEEEEKKKA